MSDITKTTVVSFLMSDSPSIEQLLLSSEQSSARSHITNADGESAMAEICRAETGQSTESVCRLFLTKVSQNLVEYVVL